MKKAGYTIFNYEEFVGHCVIAESGSTTESRLTLFEFDGAGTSTKFIQRATRQGSYSLGTDHQEILCKEMEKELPWFNDKEFQFTASDMKGNPIAL